MDRDINPDHDDIYAHLEIDDGTHGCQPTVQQTQDDDVVFDEECLGEDPGDVDPKNVVFEESDFEVTAEDYGEDPDIECEASMEIAAGLAAKSDDDEFDEEGRLLLRAPLKSLPRPEPTILHPRGDRTPPKGWKPPSVAPSSPPRRTVPPPPPVRRV